MRQFLVVRTGARTVVIREVPTGSCAHYWGREDAWAWARQLAKPAPRRQGKPYPAADIHYMAPDGSTRLVLAAAETSRALPTGKPARQRMSDEERRAKRNEYRRNRRAARKAQAA